MIRFEYRDSLTKALREFPRETAKQLIRASKRSASQVEQIAKSEHRFKTDTGQLVKSIKSYGTTFEVKLVLHDATHPMGTDYGLYVHEGHGSWGKDQFIDKAMEKGERKIFENWEKAIEIAVRRINQT